jgi:hypothetical protein
VSIWKKRLWTVDEQLCTHRITSQLSVTGVFSSSDSRSESELISWNWSEVRFVILNFCKEKDFDYNVCLYVCAMRGVNVGSYV